VDLITYDLDSGLCRAQVRPLHFWLVGNFSNNTKFVAEKIKNAHSDPSAAPPSSSRLAAVKSGWLSGRRAVENSASGGANIFRRRHSLSAEINAKCSSTLSIRPRASTDYEWKVLILQQYFWTFFCELPAYLILYAVNFWPKVKAALVVLHVSSVCLSSVTYMLWLNGRS